MHSRTTPGRAMSVKCATPWSGRPSFATARWWKPSTCRRDSAKSSLRSSAEDGDTVHLGVGTTVEEAEKRLILKTLESTNNNKTRAAEILGISLKTLHNKLKEYGSATADAALARKIVRELHCNRLSQYLSGNSSAKCQCSIMRRKTKIVLAITFMVAVLVLGFSYIYISELLRQRVTTAHESAAQLTSNLAYLAANAIPDLSSTKVDTTNPQAMRRAVGYYLGTDRDLNNFLESVVGTWPIIYDAAIVDSDGKAILHTNPDLVGKVVPDRPDFQLVRECQLSPAVSHGLQPAHGVRRAHSAAIGWSSFRKHPSRRFHGFSEERTDSPVAPGGDLLQYRDSVLLAAGRRAFPSGARPAGTNQPQPGQRHRGTAEAGAEPESSHDEYGLVSLKIAHLGRQMRDAKEIFSALKDNVDQIMGNLLDGLMLFTRDSRVVLVSASVERFLGRPRRELLGHSAREIFSSESEFGALMLQSFERRSPVSQREIEFPNGKRVQILSISFGRRRRRSARC